MFCKCPVDLIHDKAGNLGRGKRRICNKSNLFPTIVVKTTKTIPAGNELLIMYSPKCKFNQPANLEQIDKWKQEIVKLERYL
jgi:hypothetical protein